MGSKIHHEKQNLEKAKRLPGNAVPHGCHNSKGDCTIFFFQLLSSQRSNIPNTWLKIQHLSMSDFPYTSVCKNVLTIIDEFDAQNGQFTLLYFFNSTLTHNQRELFVIKD